MNILRNGTAERKPLDKIQAEITATRKAITDIAEAPLTSDETRADLVAWLRKSCDEWTLSGQFGNFSIPDKRGWSIRETTLTWFDLANLLGVQKVADLLLPHAVAPQPHGLPMKDRTLKVQELHSDLDALERAEELETLRLEGAGHVVLRREDARPEILFAIWGQAAPQPAAGAKS